MKKLLVTFLFAVFVSTALPQGSVRFLNATALISCATFDSGRPPSLMPANRGTPETTFYFALLCAPPGTTDPFVFAGVYATNLTTAGLINGGSTCNSSWPPAATRSFMVAGWSADAGPVWSQTWLTSPPCASYFGFSAIATGISGGIDPVTGGPVPTLTLLGPDNRLVLYPRWPDFGGFTVAPTNQAVNLGTPVLMCAACSGCWGAFQWYFNGTPVWYSTGRTSCYSIVSAQLINAGDYLVIGSANGYDFRTSAVAHLTVVIPPSILGQPQSQTAEVGSNVQFQVTATGTPPPSYQWFFNGSNPVAAATAARLVIPAAQTSDAGPYTVVISTSSGAVTSTPAILNMIAPVPRTIVPALTLTGHSGMSLSLDFAEAIGSSPGWAPLDTVDLTSSSQWYFDLSTPLPGERFYRAFQSGPLTVGPALDLHMVPAITLPGSIGTSVRVDYINQFGPTDAWVTLATVALTNSPQLYFDTSMIGQPPRLYRLVQP